MQRSTLSSRRIFSRRRASPSKMVLMLIPALLILYSLLPAGRSTRSRPPPDPTYGLLDETSAARRLAIATFLTAGDSDSGSGSGSAVSASEFLSNPYFAATRTLLHQLLHGAETRINASSAGADVDVDVVVLVTPDVPPEARLQLSREGAVVIQAQPIPLRWWVRTGVTRWKDQFLKLRLLEQTQYKRLLFIDADTLLTSRVDALLAEPEVALPAPTLHGRSRPDEIPLLPAQYVFAARSNNQFTGERGHPFPPLNADLFSAGFWAAAPSAELFAYLLSVMDHYRRFDPHTMEQSLLNYAFRRGGPMPWRELHYRWSATWPSGRDLAGGVVSLHDKFWKTGPEELQALWARRRDEMERYWSEHAT
ncbi:hypothetical protein EsDP_00003796 [Epichloe bromicola]|uniref:Glycosyltransferase family 8 protein n=1 Tax=Epichloe bromicola TaxID=79588 RepID=A0ABQ0CPT4_9HYPO